MQNKLLITLTGILALCLIIFACSVNAIAETTTTSEADIPSDNLLIVEIKALDQEFVEYTTSQENYDAMQECNERMITAHEMAECARELGYEENCVVIKLAQKEYKLALQQYKLYEEQYELLKDNLDAQREEFPVATYVWEYFIERGYNEYVVAGILGNLMAECGGQTLNLNHTANNSSFYGMIQWSKKYYPSINGAGLEEQCDYLYNTIETIFNTYGKNYKSGFNYKQFLELYNEKDAALAFAKCYERCSSASYEKRQTNATKAYKYYLGD